jgi:transcriptional regulator NrdR family protein
MLPMKCPKCASSKIQAAITNNRFDAQTVRKRRCADCGHNWFTVELEVSRYLIGWSKKHQQKPVVRRSTTLEPWVTPYDPADVSDEEM